MSGEPFQPLGAVSDTSEIAPARPNLFVTAYLALAGILVPLACILMELADDHPCRRHTRMDPLQYPWQWLSILAVSATHLAYFMGLRGLRLWLLLGWSLLTCCGFTIWFAPAAPMGFYAGPAGLLMFGPLIALISTLLLVLRSGLPRLLFWAACLIGWSCVSYSLKLSAFSH